MTGLVTGLVTRVVIVGNGMVGARLAEEIRRRDPSGARVRLTVLGAEHRPAYNRVLLPSLLAGTLTEDDLGLGAVDACVRTGAAVASVDRAARVVVTDGGERVPYDRLVLATGARAAVPPLPGLLEERGFARGVTPLRTLADARRLRLLTDRARRHGGRIAVLGGGVLGLEAARALAARGVAVTVVHPAPYVMDRQLDAQGGRVLARALRRTGVELRLGGGAARWEPGRGLRLDDGELLPAHGLLLSTGARAETGLAAACGLDVDPTGVAVDATLTTSDPAVHALGDCASLAPGLVQPGWEQAEVLADRLTGADPYARYAGTPQVTRLKAAGIELACLGDPLTEPPDAEGESDEPEVLRLEDPARERYTKLVLRGGRVSGAILLGVPDAAAGLVQLYDRGAPAPSDRLALMLGRALPPESGGGPAALPDHSTVCRCNSVTKGALRSAWHAGAKSTDELATATRATTGCGGCRAAVDKIAAWLAETDPVPDPDPVPVP
ncbi:FAD-dependent oxidoreductase [Streptomyces sp. NPDC048172]|uniref:FAD-dependent oxidoreductase n=1 Tax=Streptomyces sp. NPDC048172 TaxID=3365505 RepID=UPI0037135EB7